MNHTPKNEAHVEALLRQRTADRRHRQVWAALAVIWGVVLGWIVWGIVGSQTEDDLAAWLVYLVPLAVLASGTVVAHVQVRETEQRLTAAS